MHKIIISLITPVLAYGAAMGYLWYEVKSGADEMIQAAAPVAVISYDSIHTSLLGDEIGLNNITIKPVITQDEFHIAELRINAPHIGYFISAGDSVDKGEMPENISLQLRRMQWDINSELFSMLEQMQNQASMAQPDNVANTLIYPDALGCGDRSTFTISDYRRMGIGNMVADATVDIGYDEQLNRTTFKINARFDRLYDIDIAVNMNDKPKAMGARIAANEFPRININYRDTGYYQLRNSYCAELNGSNIEAYIDHHVDLLSNKLGAAFPEQTITAYKGFVQKGGSFAVKLDPSNELPLDSLHYYKPADIIAMLGLSIRINNASLKFDQFNWGDERKGTMVKSATDKKSASAAIRGVSHPPRELIPNSTAKPRATPSLRIIDVDDAPKHINRMAEVTTAQGKIRRGLLEEANEDRVTLVMKLSAGTISYPIENSNIDKLRVHY